MALRDRNKSAPEAEAEAEADPSTKFMNTGGKCGCFTIAAPDGTRFTCHDEIKYAADKWTAAQVKAGILNKVA